MTASSEFGYFVDMDTSEHLLQHGPISASSSRYLVNNLLHAHDISTQYLINWVSTEDGAELTTTFAAANTWEIMTNYVFPVSYSRYQGGPESLVLRLAIATSAATLTVLAVVQPHYIDVTLDNDDVDRIYGEEVTTTSATAAWKIDANIDAGGYPANIDAITQQTEREIAFTEFDSDTASVLMPMYRLTLWGKHTAGGANGYISGVMLREFHR